MTFLPRGLDVVAGLAPVVDEARVLRLSYAPTWGRTVFVVVSLDDGALEIVVPGPRFRSVAREVLFGERSATPVEGTRRATSVLEADERRAIDELSRGVHGGTIRGTTGTWSRWSSACPERIR